jgi:hypothetical protein
MASIGETPLQWKKVFQNWLPSCVGGPMTLGTTWPVMKSKEEGAHRLSVTRSGVGVGRVKLELQNLVENTMSPWRSSERKESKGGWLELRLTCDGPEAEQSGCNGEETEWSGKRGERSSCSLMQ